MSIDPSDLVDKSAYVSTPHDPAPLQTLIWHKVEGKGQRPAARVLHSAAAHDESVYIFGGVQAGARTNSLVSLDITTSTWAALALTSSGAHACPSPRAMHAACMLGSVMLVHGGEGDALPPPSSSSSPHSAAAAATPTKAANANNAYNNANTDTSASSVLSVPPPAAQQPHPGAPSQATGGVEGDRLGLKLKAGLRIARPRDGHNKGDKGGQEEQDGGKEQGHGAGTGQGKDASEGGGDSRSLEDLWGFNTVTGEWRQVPCSLAPLPRYGHSLCLAPLPSAPSSSSSSSSHAHNSNINQQHAHAHSSSSSSSAAHLHTSSSQAVLGAAETEHVLMFGGRCPETDTVTNAVHVCAAADLLGAFFVLGAAGGAGAAAGAGGIGRGAGAGAVAGSARMGPQWRTLQTSGPPPSGRYRHSATLLHCDGTPFLCVVGGLDRRHRPLADAHLLNLRTLQWRQVERRAESGDWPYGLFGHSAWAAPPLPPLSSSSHTSSHPSSSGYQGDTCLVVFGGSGAGGGAEDEDGGDDEGASERGCRSAMLSFDPFHPSAPWRRLSGSLAAPTARVGQSACVCVGWGMSHPLPVPLQVGAPRPSAAAMLTMMDTLTPPTRGGFGVVVMAGGRGENLFPSDAWLLDLTWRQPGVDGYDGSVLGRTMGQLASYSQQQHTQYQQGMGMGIGMGMGMDGGPYSLTPLDPFYGDSRRPSVESLGVGVGMGMGMGVGGGYGGGYGGGVGGTTGVLHSSASVPLLSNAFGAAPPHPSPSLSLSLAPDLGVSIHGLRRDRAVADVHVARERERAEGLVRRVQDLERELGEERRAGAEELRRLEAEARELRAALVQAAKRESALVGLCAEAQRLLVLRAVGAVGGMDGMAGTMGEMGVLGVLGEGIGFERQGNVWDRG